MSRVDVAITCYNYARFLRPCVESVLSQSHRDCRVLILDDASTDETPALGAALAGEDDRVHFLRHPENLGHVATYNDAIRRAEGDYFLVMSADDLLLPGALARAVATLDRQPEIGLVIGAWTRDVSGKPDGSPAPSRSPGLLDPATFIWDLVLDNRVATATAIARTTVQKQLGGYLPALPHSGDMEMWLRFALNSRVVYVDALQAVYRLHETSMSHNYSGLDDFEQRVVAITMHLRKIRSIPGYGPALARRIRRRLMRLSISWAGVAVRKGQFGRALSVLANVM
jgi:glycosyltransferase involved in cell wall biosynthesis